MRIVTIEDDGRKIKCYEGDFICLDQMIEDALEILKPYAAPTAVQYLMLAKELLHQRRQEVFNEDKETYIGSLVTEGSVPDIDFKDTRYRKA